MKLIIKNGYLTLDGRKYEKLNTSEKQIFRVLLNEERGLKEQSKTNFFRSYKRGNETGLQSGVATEIKNSIINVVKVKDLRFEQPILN